MIPRQESKSCYFTEKEDGILGKEKVESVMWCENFNLDIIVTPVDAEEFKKLLNEAGYPEDKINFIYEGFTQGFSLEYEGPKNVKMKAANLPFSIGDKTELWNKVMKEVAEKRYAGPFSEILYEYYIQSPIGLVPKDRGKKTQLIFHLSHPKKGGTSVNARILKEKCSVSYPDFNEVVQLCLLAGKSCKMGKSDMSSAFRHLPLKRRYRGT